jgi:2-methylcitrate dehydratase PrpD
VPAYGWQLPRTLFKYHAACYLTHAAIEATSAAVDGPDDLERVTLTVNPSLLDVCGIPRPRTGLEAKFSLAATTAFTLLDIDTSDPASFNDANANDPRVQAIIDKIDVATDERLGTSEARVEARGPGGTRTADYDSGVPASDLADQERKLRAKFDALVEPVLGADAKALAERIDQLCDLPSARLLVPGPPACA